MVAVDSDRKREGEGIGGVSRGAGEGCACARKQADVRVAEVNYPGIGVGIDGNGDGIIEATGDVACRAGDGLAAGVEDRHASQAAVYGGGAFFVGDPDIVLRINGEAIALGQAVASNAIGKDGRTRRSELRYGADGSAPRCVAAVAGDQDIASRVDTETGWRGHAATAKPDEERPVGWSCGKGRHEGGAGCRLGVERGDVAPRVAHDIERGVEGVEWG